MSLATMLEWKYGPVACTAQAKPKDKSPNPEMIISGWRHPTISQPSKAQLKKDFAEYELYVEAKTQKSVARENAKQALKDKHKDKKASELTDADVIEWNRQKMVEDLGLEI